MPDRYRKLQRLSGFNYSTDGFYFITICIKDRIEYFGNIKDGRMVLNGFGEIVKECWFDLINHYKNIILDEFIVMPNHVHGIIIIDDGGFNKPEIDVGTGLKPVPTSELITKQHSLSEIIRGFKTFSSRRINEIEPFRWQRSFYDHIVRDDYDLNRIRSYIQNNTSNWGTDRNNTESSP
jgi:putative transposase